MAFSDKTYKSLGEVLNAFQVNYELSEKMGEIQPITVPLYLAQEIRFVLNNIAYKTSEESICENILYPILKEVWKPYALIFSLWSHKTIFYDKKLTGRPDYLISKRSPLGHIVFERPYIAVVEAKLDDFVGGWAQCALEMLAMQKLNQSPENPIFGIVANGDIWQFAQLQHTTFTEFEQKATLDNLPFLYGTLQFLMEKCKEIYQK